MNARLYAEAKRDKIKEIVILLDLFDGKLTLTDILNTDLPLLHQMKDIKIELTNQRDATNKYDNVTTVSLDVVKERLGKKQ